MMREGRDEGCYDARSKGEEVRRENMEKEQITKVSK